LLKLLYQKKDPQTTLVSRMGAIPCLPAGGKGARGSWRIASMRRRRPKATTTLSWEFALTNR